MTNPRQQFEGDALYSAGIHLQLRVQLIFEEPKAKGFSEN